MEPSIVLAVVAAVAMMVDWWAVRGDRGRAENIAKPLVMVALIGIAIGADITPSSARPWLLAALALGLIGDVCLLPRIDRFVAGLGAFLLGHLSYLVAFSTVIDRESLGWMVMIGVVGSVALMLWTGVDVVRSLAGSSLLWPVVAYIGVTVAIVLAGAATGRWLVAMGALAFALSDGLLGSDRFVRAAPGHRVLVHVLYHSGQAAILAGFTDVGS